MQKCYSFTKMLKHLLSLLKKLGSCCLKQCCWVCYILWVYFFNHTRGVSGVIGHILVHLASNSSIHLAGKSTVYQPVCTLSTCNALQSSVGGIKGCGVVERVMDTLLNLQKK